MENKYQFDFEAAKEYLPVGNLLKNKKIIDGQSKVVQIYHILWELIVTVQLRPGQLVSEKEISDCLKASKTPVREALIKLEDVGLVTVVPKSGTYVTGIKISTYIEACFTRLQLEIGAVRRAASRHHDTHRQAMLDDIIARQAAALEIDDHQTFFELDERLHEHFFIMAGVTGVWAIVKRSQSEVYRIRHLKQMFQVRRGAQVLAQHRAIVDAIREGNSDAAEKALVAHIGSLEGEIEELTAHPAILAFIENAGAPKQRSRGPTSR